MSAQTITHYRRCVEEEDLDALLPVLNENVVFSSPTVTFPFVGASTFIEVLRSLQEIFKDFRFTHEAHGGESHVLLFDVTIGPDRARGVDFVVFDSQGRISELRVYLAPLTALVGVAQAVYPRLLRKGVLPAALTV